MESCVSLCFGDGGSEELYRPREGPFELKDGRPEVVNENVESLR